MANVIDKITKKQLNPNVPEFRVGDTVRVDVKIIEGKRERIQAFEGVVISRKGSGISETFTVRKVSYGVGVGNLSFINFVCFLYSSSVYTLSPPVFIANNSVCI